MPTISSLAAFARTHLRVDALVGLLLLSSLALLLGHERARELACRIAHLHAGTGDCTHDLLRLLLVFGLGALTMVALRSAQSPAAGSRRSAPVRPACGCDGDADPDDRCLSCECPGNRSFQLGAMLAHELGQPLSALTAFVSTALRRLPAGRPDLAEMLTTVQDQARRANQIVVHLRTLAQSARVRREPVSLHRLMDSLLRHLPPANEAITLEVHLASELPPVSADPVLIEMVISNLINNATQAVERGPSHHPHAVRIDAVPSPEGARISVRDSGPGFPEEKIEVLFEPFVSYRDGGLGIGLALASAIVEAHGGRLWARNVGGGGAEVSFTLQRSEV